MKKIVKKSIKDFKKNQTSIISSQQKNKIKGGIGSEDLIET